MCWVITHIIFIPHPIFPIPDIDYVIPTTRMCVSAILILLRHFEHDMISNQAEN